MTGRFRRDVISLLYAAPPRWIVWLCLIGLNLAYIAVSVHIPIALYPGAIHDDGLYMRLGRSLAEGEWLGPFNQFTLMKGPGYPAFLALTSLFGISVTLAHALFHCFACTFFVVVCHRFVRSAVLSGLMLTLLLWQPVTLTEPLRRVFREEIYYGQILLILGLTIVTLFSARSARERLLYGALTGLAFGWFWLTREEGFWLLPVLVLLCVFSVLHCYRYWYLRRVAAALTVAIVMFAGTQAAFRGLNWWYYGKFVGVDFKEANFQKALGAIHSVRSGGIRPFIPVTHEARRQIYRVSPTFASLEYFFDLPDRPLRSGWVEMTCEMVPESCGEVGAGWFMWALRDAAAFRGHYASPARASVFFGQIAAEITAACARGDLDCRPQLLAELPPVNWGEVIARFPSRLWRAWDLLIITRWPLPLNSSAGSEAQLAQEMRFLNFPYHVLPARERNPVPYTISGWYHKSGKVWFSVAAKTPGGADENVEVKRLASPMLPGVRNDPAADEQRYVISLRCTDDCVLTFAAADGEQVKRTLGELQLGVKGFALGGGILAVETVEKEVNPFTTPTHADRAAERVRLMLVTSYPWLFLPTGVLGLLAFLAATLIYPRHALLKVTYMLALSCWALVVLRTLLLALIDATSFPTLQLFYIYPAHFMAVAGAVLSIAALLDLSGYAPQRGGFVKTLS